MSNLTPREKLNIGHVFTEEEIEGLIEELEDYEAQDTYENTLPAKIDEVLEEVIKLKDMIGKKDRGVLDKVEEIIVILRDQ